MEPLAWDNVNHVVLTALFKRNFLTNNCEILYLRAADSHSLNIFMLKSVFFFLNHKGRKRFRDWEDKVGIKDMKL